MLELFNNLDFIVHPFFTEEEIDQLAKETRFVQRKGKISGRLFFELIVFHSETLKSQSLNDLSVTLYDRHDIKIKKQSLHERFNNNAVFFLKEALNRMLRKQLDLCITKNNTRFKRILIKDSTCFQIDSSLADAYPGSGGNGSKASVRIQFEYDALSGNVNDLSIHPFNEQDATNSIATIELTREDDLIIRDLAYMSLSVLQSIQTMKAFFLCRANPSVNIFEKQSDNDGFQKVDFVKMRKHMQNNGLQYIEKEVYLGKNEQFKTRLIVYLLPEKDIAERIRKAERNNKKKGQKPLSKEYKARAALNLFISNASPEMIPVKKAWLLYRYRWQIELIFKIWKTICHIEKIKKVKKDRLECYILSKLILIMLGWKILWRTAQLLIVTDGKYLSFYKAAKTLINRMMEQLRTVFLLGNGRTKTFMEKFYKISKRNHLLEHRMGEPTSMELLFHCLSHDFLNYN